MASKSKLFSGAAVGFGAGPNEQVSLVDAAMPGMLPVINRDCVEQAVRSGLGLKAKINTWSRFDRKNYFYPDLPQGYQISQYKDPIVGEGEVEVERDDGTSFIVRIERLHLEQDAGKSIHDLDPNATYVDLNRAGTALMEIVSYPGHALVGRGGGLCEEGAHHPALPRHLRRRHGEGQPARRRERLGAQGRAARSAPAARSRTSTPTATSSRPSSTRRAARSRSSRTAARSTRRRGCSIPTRARPARCARRKRRTTTATSPTRTCLPLELDPAWIKAIEATPAGAAGRQAPAADEPVRPLGLRRRRAGDRGRAGRLLRGRRQGPRRQAGRQLGRPTSSWATWPRTASTSTTARSRAADIAGLVELIETGVISSKIAREVFEHMWAGEGAAAGDRRDARPAPGQRHRRAGGDGRRADRRQPRPGRGGEDQAAGDRLVRRPGDARDPGQGQPRRGQRRS